MKNVCSLLFLFLIGLTVNAQSRYYEFTYDNSGNRVMREYIDLTAQEDPIGVEDPLTANGGDEESAIVATNNQSKTEEEVNSERKSIVSSELAGRPIDIYPNPTEGRLLIAIADFDPEENGEWVVVSVSGKIIDHSNELSAEIPIDLSAEATGRYILKLRIGGDYKEWVIVKQ